MSKKTIKNAIEYYDDIVSYDERRKLQDEFGQYDTPNREAKFYKWIRDNKLNGGTIQYCMNCGKKMITWACECELMD